MAKIVHADAPEPLRRIRSKSLAILLRCAYPSVAPARGDHVLQAAARMATLGCEHVLAMLTAEFLQDRLSTVIEHDNAGAPSFDEVGREHKHASLESGRVQFWDSNFPFPLQPTEFLISEACVHCKQRDAATIGGEFVDRRDISRPLRGTS